ncbi:MAG TPA: SDR family NAD(P)-dependent oxidoreductase [Rectinemataceae bacterium]|nr:SDR family NAD(P)-dependent oxidoreductase [Rectinemataceae bacterium]
MIRKTVLITGSTSGIGLAGAEALGAKGWRVLVHGRSEARLAPVLDALTTRVGGGEFVGVTGELGSLAAVAALADQVRTKTDQLEALWNNAGGLAPSYELGPDGVERQMAVNYLAPAALSRLLLPLLRAAPQGRILITSSMAHSFAPRRIDAWLTPGARRYRPMAVYGQSKLATILFSRELARRLDHGGVTVNAYHPGFVRSGFGSGGDPDRKGSFGFASFIALSPEQGADTGVWLLDDPAVAGESGGYWIKRSLRKPSAAVTEEEATRLWELTEALLSRRLGTLPL